MIKVERPDLSQAKADVVAYVELLEAEIERLTRREEQFPADDAETQFNEPVTTINVVTISSSNAAKRTPRHLYSRQRRGGMGVFGMQTGKDNHAALVVVADEEQHLLMFSNFGRAFRLPVDALAEAAVRDQGQSLEDILPFRPHERIAAVLPDEGGEFAALASKRGWVRRVRANYLGKSLIPGMTFHDVKEGGYLTAACWTAGDGDLLMVTRQGKGIRFDETQVSGRGGRGMRVHPDDGIVAVAAVYPDSGVFLITEDGKGTIRLMSGFTANKAPGAGGKNVMNTDRLVGGVTITEEDELFITSRLNKIIRFQASEVPPKAGVVQGVNCISLRGDAVTAVARSIPVNSPT